METAPLLNQWHTQTVAYNRRDLLLYALGIGCGPEDPQFTFEKHAAFSAFPTYATVLYFKGTSQDVLAFPSPAMIEGAKPPDLPGQVVGLDGEKHIEMLAPLPPCGGWLTMRSRLISVKKKGSGAVVETEMVISHHESDTPLYRITSASFLVGAKDFKDSGISRSTKVSIPERAPDAIQEFPVPANQALVYRLSGDYNPLHADPEFALTAGYKDPIMHGLCTLGYSTRAVLKHFASSDPAKFRQVCVRFSSPVIPGQTLRIEMWDEGAGRIVFRTVVKETGKVAISNSYVQLAAVHSKL